MSRPKARQTYDYVCVRINVYIYILYIVYRLYLHIIQMMHTNVAGMLYCILTHTCCANEQRIFSGLAVCYFDKLQ